ncbi:hypothetical protein NE237_033162 [Protea cynaroides]|uniref:Uncharacterized protein n=1 Tax=Protea cynaroides TaxID=273540 RepID=A0A9Q0L518_9MAGN|nr:hypothetical protein NE237_033162 [Protea cynaroides]
MGFNTESSVIEILPYINEIKKHPLPLLYKEFLGEGIRFYEDPRSVGNSPVNRRSSVISPSLLCLHQRSAWSKWCHCFSRLIVVLRRMRDFYMDIFFLCNLQMKKKRVTLSVVVVENDRDLFLIWSSFSDVAEKSKNSASLYNLEDRKLKVANGAFDTAEVYGLKGYIDGLGDAVEQGLVKAVGVSITMVIFHLQQHDHLIPFDVKSLRFWLFRSLWMTTSEEYSNLQGGRLPGVEVEPVDKTGAGEASGVKSCKLRWTNYLRPDLKRGLLSESEEHMINDLHAALGNRSQEPLSIFPCSVDGPKIAAHLPGRTDNEKSLDGTIMSFLKQTSTTTATRICPF